MEYKTPKQYAADHPEIAWEKKRDEFYLYRMSSQRFKVTMEQGVLPDILAWDVGLSSQYGEAGIDEALLDAEAFADDFIKLFCNHLSLYDLSVLLPKLQQHYDEWEARRQRSIKLMEASNAINLSCNSLS